MQDLEVKIPISADLSNVEVLVERICRSRGLQTQVKKPAASHRGSTHWHFKKGTEKGTLEVTYWPQERRLWVSVHANRSSGWTSKESAEVKSALESELERRSGS
jgi:hypothetical protein